jgi:hypothetical protein
MNRAHLDRAFGELFTVLGSEEPLPIILPHQPPGNRELVTPRRFRILGTLNSIDKQFVNSLGQGLKRRFTFLTVDIPPRREPGGAWTSEPAGGSLAHREFKFVLAAARSRLAKRVRPGDEAADAETEGRIEALIEAMRADYERLFDLVERVRYAVDGADEPYLPIGTAQLIDTVELAASRLWIEATAEGSVGRAFDWAASVKLAPLFDTDLRPDVLKRFAEGAPGPFDGAFRRELLQIVSAGLYYVG